MMCERYAKLIATYHFKCQTLVGCEDLKYREDKPDEYATIISSTRQTVNLKKIQPYTLDPQSEIRTKHHKIEISHQALDRIYKKN